MLNPGELPFRPNVWIKVSSSWIRALRFVPTGLGTKRHVVGLVDMNVKWKNRKYRYGNRRPIYAERFDDWIEAASKGKYWWYRFTAEYSPADRIG